MAFQALYSWDANSGISGGNAADEITKSSMPEGLLDFSWNYKSDGTPAFTDATADFSRLLVTGTMENIRSIDSMIQKHLKNWSIERLNRVDRAILRMSVYTLMFQSDMPPSIIIDEAICIAREFGTADSYSFVNGVLDAVLKTLIKAGKHGT
jgi:N utilization substance protein B